MLSVVKVMEIWSLWGDEEAVEKKNSVQMGRAPRTGPT